MTTGRNIVIKTSSTISYASRPDVLAYLASNRPIVGTYVNAETATFDRGWYTAPSDAPPNSVDQFEFYVNGSKVEQTGITSFQNLGGSSTLVIDSVTLGYSLEANDTIIAIGKFS